MVRKLKERFTGYKACNTYRMSHITTLSRDIRNRIDILMLTNHPMQVSYSHQRPTTD